MIIKENPSWFATLPIMSEEQAKVIFEHYKQFWKEVEIANHGNGIWVIKFRFMKGE